METWEAGRTEGLKAYISSIYADGASGSLAEDFWKLAARDGEQSRPLWPKSYKDLKQHAGAGCLGWPPLESQIQAALGMLSHGWELASEGSGHHLLTPLPDTPAVFQTPSRCHGALESKHTPT